MISSCPEGYAEILFQRQQSAHVADRLRPSRYARLGDGHTV